MTRRQGAWNLLTSLGQAAYYELHLNRRPRWMRVERIWWVTTSIIPTVLRAYGRAWRGEVGPRASTRG